MSELFLYTHFIDEPKVSFLFFSELKKYCYLNLSTDLKDIFFYFCAPNSARAENTKKEQEGFSILECFSFNTYISTF